MQQAPSGNTCDQVSYITAQAIVIALAFIVPLPVLRLLLVSSSLELSITGMGAEGQRLPL